MPALHARTFRSNPRYELVVLDRLPQVERAHVGAEGADVYGVFRPHEGSGLEPRIASTDTALLFLTLRQPAGLPTYVVERLGDDLDRHVRRLCFDGVLEVEHEGKYLCGMDAYAVLGTSVPPNERARTDGLSIAALRYGQDLAGLPSPALAQRLYAYGSRPVSPALAREMPDEAAISARLGIAPGDRAYARLKDDWVEGPRGSPWAVYWRSWRPRRVHARTDGLDARYKLYVSPDLDGLPVAIEAVAGTLAKERGVQAFKLAAGLHGVCRPDKLIVYFTHLDDLQRGAAKLRERLAGGAAQGVPFTAAVTSDGMLSWGLDPPAIGDGGGPTSWRGWVTDRLAEYLAAAPAHGSGDLEPWEFALDRLRLAGIDTTTWVPADGRWQEIFATV
jgi:hypothetical protein